MSDVAAPVPKTNPKAPPAAPKTEAPKPVAIVAGDRKTVPWSALHRSKLNPRGHFDPERLKGLADSIAVEGVLQNLTVRPDAKHKDEYEIVAGDSRYQAIEQLIKAGRAKADFPVPVLIRQLDDTHVIALAMTENMARKELTPMEEARGFHSLVERGIGTAMIAERIGVTQRFVQQRLALVEKAAVEVQAALEEGKITVTHARTLMLAKPTEQKKLVKRMTAPADEDDSDDYDNEWLRDERNLRNEVLGNVPETAWALFDRKLYKGEIIEDGGGKSYFADRKQFEKLQKAAVDAKAEELRKTFTFVDVTDDFRDWEWEVDAKSKDAAIIETHHGGRVSIHTGLVAREQPSYSRGGGSDAAFLNKSTKKAAPEDAFTHGHRVHAHVRKTFALQRTIAADSPTAMRMLCHALLLSVRAPALNIGRKDSRYDCGSFKDYDGPTTAPEVNEILAELIDGCPGVKMSAKSGLGTAAATHALAIWTWLTKQSVEKVVRLLAALTADCAGTWCDGYNMPIDDDEVAVAIAQQVNLAGNEHKCGLTLQPADLDGLRKPALAGIARDLKIDLKVGVHALTKMTGKAVTAEICSAIDAGDAKTYVLPTLRFTADSAAEIKALTKDPAAKAAAKPATKAKANKKAKR